MNSSAHLTSAPTIVNAEALSEYLRTRKALRQVSKMREGEDGASQRVLLFVTAVPFCTTYYKAVRVGGGG
jgi:hypothetical protein